MKEKISLTPELVKSLIGDYHATHGRYPTASKGHRGKEIACGHLKWRDVDNGFRLGLYGLKKGGSLCKFVAENFGVRNRSNIVQLSMEKVLTAAEKHYEKHGEYPTRSSGNIDGYNGETWQIWDWALNDGRHGLPKTSLRKVLIDAGKVKNATLTVGRIVELVRSYKEFTGKFPCTQIKQDGKWIADKKWAAINAALTAGGRGLSDDPKYSEDVNTLARLIKKYFADYQYGNKLDAPILTINMILSYADFELSNNTTWNKSSGKVSANLTETWSGINAALKTGLRGLAEDPMWSQDVSSVAKLLGKHRNVWQKGTILELDKIDSLIIEYEEEKGTYPKQTSGEIEELGIGWGAIDGILRNHYRSCLADRVAITLGVRNKGKLPPLTRQQIISWVAEYHKECGDYPTRSSGKINGTDGETWGRVNQALIKQYRGLSGESSLAKLIEDEFGYRYGNQESREYLIEAIKSIKDSLDWLPLSAWWYILLQSGIEPTARHARLLKANQGGKLSLEELIDATIGGEDVNDDEENLLQKFKKPDSFKILKLLESPIFAGMDSEAIAAIMAELKSQLWERIYEDEDNEIEKLRNAESAVKGAA